MYVYTEVYGGTYLLCMYVHTPVLLYQVERHIRLCMYVRTHVRATGCYTLILTAYKQHRTARNSIILQLH